MRLGVDARVLVHRPTGVARYLAGILGELRSLMGSGDRLVLFVDEDPQGELPGQPDELVVVRWPLPGGDPLWRQARLGGAASRAGVDLLWCPFYSVPLFSGPPSVVTIHDVGFEVHPEWFDWKGRLAFRLARPSAGRARRVLTVSEFSAGEIVRLLGVQRAKIDVTPLATDPAWSLAPSPGERAGLRAWLGFDEPYVLHLGAVHARRHPDALVEAFAALPAPLRSAHRLVIAGPSIDPCPDVEARARDLGIAERLKRVHWVPEEQLRALVAEASTLVYLSAYEGFGLPALEALAAGTPLVCLRRASLPEVCGEAALWVDEPTGAAVAPLVARLLSGGEERAALRAAGAAQAARFSWRRTAEDTWSSLSRALDPSGGSSGPS